jgi:hypothetical protein
MGSASPEARSSYWCPSVGRRRQLVVLPVLDENGHCNAAVADSTRIPFESISFQPLGPLDYDPSIVTIAFYVPMCNVTFNSMPTGAVG